MAQFAAGDCGPPDGARSLTTIATATVVAVGPRDRMVEAAEALKAHAHTGGIRAILIATGERPTPEVRVTASEIALDGLRATFMNNAIAALRLPSLPALLWWRGGEPSQAEDAARLADRLVLDAEDPKPLWARIGNLLEEAAVSDLRWTALTRWRALMAHFFDMPGVLPAAARFSRLQLAGNDTAAAHLFAAWLRVALNLPKTQVHIEQRPGAALEAVTFGNGDDELSLRRLAGSQCVEGRARVDGREVSRIASLGDLSLEALIAEELRVRSRDAVFESAVHAAGAFA
jgi:hypothetical protein